MSWSGFKKNVGRATTQVMMKTGHVEKTSDREYEVEERRYRTLESASLRLQKEAKGYLDSLRAMTASQMRIAETIDAFYGDSGAKDGVSRSYKQAVEDLDAETIKALDGPYRYVEHDESTGRGSIDIERTQLVEEEGGVYEYIHRPYGYSGYSSKPGDEEAHKLMDDIYRTTVLEPINRFCAYFPDINECKQRLDTRRKTCEALCEDLAKQKLLSGIKKRNHKLLDYDAMRAKVKKLVEKPDKDPGKLPRTEKETEMVNDLSSFDEMISPPPEPGFGGYFDVAGLEEQLAPLREDYTRRKEIDFEQAKAAYDQLNEQLTSELPQLIDLRVPYLDPSFEALVKIQLRFCAEAYSRMAQVQQYLDASTRDQYASGDLDQRVEDVLGQIRELSIAGTV